MPSLGINWFNGLEIALREIEQKQQEGKQEKLRIIVLKPGTRKGAHREDNTP